MASYITCQNFAGGTIDVLKSEILTRVGVYAFIFHPDKDKLLLVRLTTGKYFLPGGEKESWETLEAAVRRETIEETGIEITDLKSVIFGENFVYYGPQEIAWHVTGIFYQATPMSIDLCDEGEVFDEEVVLPEWVSVHEITKEMWQIPEKYDFFRALIGQLHFDLVRPV